MPENQYEIMRKIRKELNLFLDNSLKEDVHVILPENLSRKFLLENKPTDIDNVKWLSGCYYIVHEIIQLSFDKRHSESKVGSYVPLSSRILQKILGLSNRKIYLDPLISLNIIESDGVYSKTKNRSFGFRLTKTYRNQYYKTRTIQDNNIKEAIIRNRKKALEALKARIKPISHIARWPLMRN